MANERFDINRCTVSGIVQKIWDHEEDIFLRVAFQDEGKLRYLTVCLPGGTVNGALVSLQPGMNIRVSGYLADNPYVETLAEFLRDARKNGLLNKLENSDALRAVSIKRVGTRLDALELEFLPAEAAPQGADVQLQGIVAKVWPSGRHLMARLVVYDRYTEILDEQGRNGLPRRKPHYISVRFTEGKVSGQPLTLKKGMRLRMTGLVHVRFYRETLREVLIRSGNAELAGSLNGIDPDEIAAIRNSVIVTADAAIVLASMGRRELVHNPAA